MFVNRVNGECLTSPETRLALSVRRAELRDLDKCINGPRVGFVGRHGTVHGPVVKGGKCQRCIDIHTARHGYVPTGRVAPTSTLVLRAIERNGPMRVRDIDIDKPMRCVSWTVQYLLSFGRVERASRDKQPLYRITDAGRAWLREQMKRAA